MIILHIDTSKIKEATVTLEIDGGKFSKTGESGKGMSQATLPLIEALLNGHGLTPKEISEIRVNPGPGSFTGLRVGMAAARTLSLLLDIPVNGKSAWEEIPLTYENTKYD